MESSVPSSPDTVIAETLFDEISVDGRAASAASPSKPTFDDGKDPEALRTIGEVARALAIRPHVLRYWEEQFPALQPIKRSGNRRYYRSEDIALIGEIDRLVHREGYTLRGAAKALSGKSSGELQSNSSDGNRLDEESVSDDFFRKLAEVREGLAIALQRA